jgi:hypothetical protein
MKTPNPNSLAAKSISFSQRSADFLSHDDGRKVKSFIIENIVSKMRAVCPECETCKHQKMEWISTDNPALMITESRCDTFCNAHLAKSGQCSEDVWGSVSQRERISGEDFAREYECRFDNSLMSTEERWIRKQRQFISKDVPRTEEEVW